MAADNPLHEEQKEVLIPDNFSKAPEKQIVSESPCELPLECNTLNCFEGETEKDWNLKCESEAKYRDTDVIQNEEPDSLKASDDDSIAVDPAAEVTVKVQ